MDLVKTLTELRLERIQVIKAIGALEALQEHWPVGRVLAGQGLIEGEKRGRKSMGQEERREVSERMRRYWAQRRQAERPAAAAGQGA